MDSHITPPSNLPDGTCQESLCCHEKVNNNAAAEIIPRGGTFYAVFVLTLTNFDNTIIINHKWRRIPVEKEGAVSISISPARRRILTWKSAASNRDHIDSFARNMV